MFIILFALWLLLNGHFALDIAFLEIVIFGIAISAAVYFFMIKFTKWDIKTDLFFIKNIHLFIAYAFVLLWSVLVSNFNVIKAVMLPGENTDPVIVNLNLPIKSEIFRAMLANSITLTPGTITISCTEEHFTVHCLKKEYIEDFENTALVKLIQKMEAKLYDN